MRATILLADSAQVADGKLYLLGGGWNITGPQPTQSAIAMLFEVPWDRANERHHVRLDLLDADGQPVPMPNPVGEAAPLVIEADFEVGRPPGLKRGTPLSLPLAVNLPPLPLPPDGRFEWRLTINGEAHEDWRAAFSTRPAP